MKTRKILPLLCLILTLLAFALPVNAAEAFEVNNIRFYVLGTQARVTGVVEATDAPIIIPETINGYPVTRISANAFGENCTGPYAVIPASVKTIENNAFRKSKIESFYFHGTETYCHTGEFAGRILYCYEGAGIEDRTYETDIIHYFEEYPCSDPYNLLPVTEGAFTYALYDGEAILLHCQAEGEVIVPDTLGGCPVTYVAPYCFEGDSYTCTLPETVRSIGQEAFVYDNYDYKQDILLTKLPRDLKWLGDSAIEPAKITDITMPTGLEKIGYRALAGIRGDKIVIPGSVKVIEEQAFMGCSIREIVIEEGVETIERGSLSLNLSSAPNTITFPASVTRCGEHFLNNNLDTMVYGYTTTPVFDYCVENDIGFTDLATGVVHFKPYTKEENGVKYYVSYGSVMIIGLSENHPDHVVIPETVDGFPVNEMHEWAFISDTLKSIYLPDTILELPEFAFEGSDVVEYIRLPGQLRSIGPTCFGGSHNVRAIYIPPTVTSIADPFCMNSRHLIIAGVEGSYAQSFANSHGHPFVAMEDDKEYIFSSGIYRIDPEGAVLLGGSMDYDWEQRCGYCIVPDEVEGIPVIGIAADAQFGRPHYGIQEHTEELYLGSNVRFIGERALLNTDIEAIYTTPALEELPVSLFPKEGKIYGYSGTYAESYAKEHGIFFYPMDGTPFNDVPEDSWFFPSVYFCYWNGIMNGTSDTTFNPTGISSRAMLVTTLYRLCGEPNPDGDSDYFADVPEYTWYTSAVDWAAENGVVYGTSATTFSPNAPVTREQVATILYRLGDLLGEDVATYSPISGFKDADQASDYAKSALMWAVDAGILQGSDKNMLNPKGATTRAEMATILLRYIAWLES